MPHSSSRTAERRRAEAQGRKAEGWAALYLRLKGYRILARRKKTPVGEIDIVAKTGKAVVFVEVKQRRRETPEADTLGAVNHARIARAAQWWQMEHPRSAGAECRFDIIVLSPGRWPRHFTHAFTLD